VEPGDRPPRRHHALEQQIEQDTAEAQESGLVRFVALGSDRIHNVPTLDLIEEVVGIGNSSGDRIDKFKQFGLTPVPGVVVRAPAIKECYASFECQLIDAKLIPKYGLFIWRVVKAHVAASVKSPQTIHYRGQGVFMVAGPTINRRRKFKPQNL
jgi:flavin reductase (DIM6/NTAB) family NADH-FMN oxidoreductase RutF